MVRPRSTAAWPSARFAVGSPIPLSLPASLTLGTDNSSAFTARAFKAILSSLGIVHRRGSYCDLESQALIESWFGKLKRRYVWRKEFETFDRARELIASSARRRTAELVGPNATRA